MDWEEPRKSPQPSLVIGEDLSRHSITEMESRIAALRREIERVEAALVARRRHDKQAADLFKS